MFSEPQKQEMNRKAKAIVKGTAVAAVLISLFAPGQAKAGKYEDQEMAHTYAIQKKMTPQQKKEYWAQYVTSILDNGDGKMDFQCKKEDNGLCYMQADLEIKDAIVVARHWFRKDQLDKARWFEQIVKREQCYIFGESHHMDCYDFDTGVKTVIGLEETAH